MSLAIKWLRLGLLRDAPLSPYGSPLALDPVHGYLEMPCWALCVSVQPYSLRLRGEDAVWDRGWPLLQTVTVVTGHGFLSQPESLLHLDGGRGGLCRLSIRAHLTGLTLNFTREYPVFVPRQHSRLRFWSGCGPSRSRGRTHIWGSWRGSWPSAIHTVSAAVQCQSPAQNPRLHCPLAQGEGRPAIDVSSLSSEASSHSDLYFSSMLVFATPALWREKGCASVLFFLC